MGESVAAASWEVPGREGASTHDPLLKCLVLLTRHFNRPFAEETLSAGLPLVDNWLTPDLFERAADRAGLTAKVIKRALGDISPLTLPAVLLLKNRRACLLNAVARDGSLEIVDPDTGGVSKATAADVESEYTGHAILVREQLHFDSRTEHSAVPRTPRTGGQAVHPA